MDVSFIINGPPKGKGRPRFSTAGGHVHAHTPQDTLVYENLVKMEYRTQCRQLFLEGPISAEIVGYFPIPASTSKKKQAQMEAGEIKYTKKIDCDNLAKTILDALNGIAYKDDSQICRLYVSKEYSSRPRTVVYLRELQPEE